MIVTPTRFVYLVVFALVASCTPRADITPVATRDDVGQVVEVLVGTTRARRPDGLYYPTGRGPLDYGAFDISIPPNHRPGEVEVGRSPDPARHFVTRDIRSFDSSGDFRAAVAQRLRENPEYRDEAFVFVHGFNNTMADGVFRTAQIKADLKVPALQVHYSWPSAGQPLGYVTDRDSALFARDGLEILIRDLSRAGVRNIILIAHSMGAHLTMETLRQMSQKGRDETWSRIGGVALLAADIDVDVFLAQARDIGALPQPFFLFTSERDKALRLSARLTPDNDRVGTLTSLERISELNVVVLDVSRFDDASNSHLTAVGSPTLIRMVQNQDLVQRAFESEAAGRTGLVPGTVLTLQEATAVLLEPAAQIADAAQ